MNTLLGDAVKGLPALAGVFWGLAIFTGQSSGWWAGATLVLAIIALRFGRFALGRWPILGWLMIELWILAAISLVALSSALIVWLTAHGPIWFESAEPDKAAVAGALIGAVTTYFAVLWMKGVQEGNGPLWPGYQFQTALIAAFKKHPTPPSGETSTWEAIYEDRVHGGPEGWHVGARLERAIILEKHLRA